MVQTLEQTHSQLKVASNEEACLDATLQTYLTEVPIYQDVGRKLLARGLTTSADILRELPFVTKLDLRKDFPASFLRAGQNLDELVREKLVEIEHTAGTTDTRADLLLPQGWWIRQEQWALKLNQHIEKLLKESNQVRRVTITSPVCNGEITFAGTPSRAQRTLGNARFLSLSRFPFLLSEEDLDRMIDETLEWNPVFLDTDPVYAVVFALHCERRKITLPQLKFVLTSYEFTSVVHRDILKRVFGVPVYNLYGATETGHLMMEDDRGCMVPSPKVAHLEVINTDERGIGELVVTTRTNDYMPLVNYRIGDLVQKQRAQSGECSYVLHGRTPDVFTISEGRKITTRDVDNCFTGMSGIAHYRLHEVAPKCFVLRYIVDRGGPEAGELAALSRRLTEILETGNLTISKTDLLLPEGSGKFVLTYPFESRKT